jgi:hypothetical protein
MTKILIRGLWEKHKSGYFFKGNFLARLKREAIEILRKGFKDYSDEEKKRFADEWKVIHYEYMRGRKTKEKINERARKTRELMKIQNPEYKNAIAKLKQLNRLKRSEEFYNKGLAEILANVERNKTNYELVNARLNKLEEDIKSILARIYVER